MYNNNVNGYTSIFGDMVSYINLFSFTAAFVAITMAAIVRPNSLRSRAQYLFIIYRLLASIANCVDQNSAGYFGFHCI